MSIAITLAALLFGAAQFVATNAWLVFPLLTAVWLACVVSDLRPRPAPCAESSRPEVLSAER